jgi:hypothetical protein
MRDLLPSGLPGNRLLQRRGNGATRRAIAVIDVNGETRTSDAALPRAAISAATPVPREIPSSVTRGAPMPCRASSSRMAAASRYSPASSGGPDSLAGP